MPKNNNSSPEMIPYSIVVEGAVDPSRLPKLIEVLSAIGTEQTVSYRFGEVEPTERPIYESDAVSQFDPAIVKRAWDRLITIAVTSEGFPLQRKYDSEKEVVYLSGHTGAALQWLIADKHGTKFNTGPVSLLRRLLDPEFNAITYRPATNNGSSTSSLNGKVVPSLPS